MQAGNTAFAERIRGAAKLPWATEPDSHSLRPDESFTQLVHRSAARKADRKTFATRVPATPTEVRAEFEKVEREQTIENFKIACLLGMVLVPAFWVVDFFQYEKLHYDFLIIRLTCSVLIAIFLKVLLSDWGRYHSRSLTVTLVLLPGSAIVWMIFLTGDPVGSPYYAGLNLVLLMTGLVLRWTLKESLIAVSLVIGEYLLACAALDQLRFVRGTNLMGNLFFIGATGIIVIFGNYHFNKARFETFRTRWELDQMNDKLKRAHTRLEEDSRTLAQAKENLLWANEDLEKVNGDLQKKQKHLEKVNKELADEQAKNLARMGLVSIGLTSAALAHEVRNHLNPMGMNLGALANKTTHLPDEQRKKFESLIADTRKGFEDLTSTVNTILSTFGGNKTDAPRDLITVQEALEGALRFHRRALESRGIRVEQQFAPDQRVWADVNQITLVLLNLMKNSIDALEMRRFQSWEKPTIWIEGRVEAGISHIFLRDNGPGIPQSNAKGLFELIRTTKPAGKGSGLGLVVCKEILKGLDGDIVLNKNLPGYCEFLITLPSQPLPGKDPVHTEMTDKLLRLS